jgi:hypothetical protein
MAQNGCDDAFEAFCNRLRQEISEYAGRVEYGNLRYKTDVWESVDGQRNTNLALVYETPGGSTDQINVSFDHSTGLFSIVDEAEHLTPCAEEVMAHVRPRVASIPERRRESLFAEIRRQIDGGVGRAGLFGHINRLMQSDFRGGTITHQELQEAMRFAVQYSRGVPPGTSPPPPPAGAGS